MSAPICFTDFFALGGIDIKIIYKFAFATYGKLAEAGFG